ncbi:hypothetical protein KUV56_08905 [Ferrimonas balearica]|uniref:hypothetical protein n=1 Tax=Ferrimonas balearica TaxID=44012 RepID=UPI001C59FA6A|nr:hypothetical protein [Ferrimonas balearica]MBW3139631.1 hypothetical protein [Ferrimonas balearica]
MPKINTDRQCIEALIDDTKANYSISHMKDEYGNVATWDSKAWAFTDGQYNTANFYFYKAEEQHSLSRARKSEPLPPPLKGLLMAYALEVSRLAATRNVKQARHRAAKQLIQECGSLGALLSQQEREAVMLPKGSSIRKEANAFLNWLNSAGGLHQSLSLLPVDTQKFRTGEEVLEYRRKMMPEENVLMALGAIQHKVIPRDKRAWNVAPTSPQRDAFICTMMALALSAPNRMIAEQSVLSAQLLKTHTETKTGQPKTVHYLHWKGSKGYRDTANHILAGMADSVSLCLEYIMAATQSMRSLARFYADPTLPLKKILNKNRVNAERWEQVDADVNQPINLLKLGYLLGFYETLERPELMVSEGTPGSIKRFSGGKNGKRHLRYFKPLWLIEDDDVISCSQHSLQRVFAASFKEPFCTAVGIPFGAKHSLTVKALQSKWIVHLHKEMPGFPKVSTGHQNGLGDMRTLLFAFNGVQLAPGNKGGGSYPGAASPFAPAPLTQFRSIMGQDIGSHRKTSIFARHGFCPSFGLRPHQTRHWVNTTALENGVARQIVNLWSGRSDPNQILHYDHEIGADKVCRISNIRFNEEPKTVEEAKKRLRVVSLEEYEQLTGQAATVTSSGVCTQDLSVKPCTFMNDFTVHCLFCPSSCHVAHDEEATTFLERDLKVQQRRLMQVSDSSKFSYSTGMQSWFRKHSILAEMLKQLVDLMTSKGTPEGAFIRLLTDQNEFRVTNLKTKSVEVRKLSLPDIDKQIKELIDKQRQGKTQVDDVTSQLLGMI